MVGFLNPQKKRSQNIYDFTVCNKGKYSYVLMFNTGYSPSHCDSRQCL